MSEREKGPDEVYCHECGEIIRAKAEICPHCGVRQRGAGTSLDDLVEGGNPFVAAVLSLLFPGLGQIYNREIGKGIVFIVLFLISAFSILALVGFVATPIVYVWSIYDAYTVADRMRTEREQAGAEPP